MVMLNNKGFAVSTILYTILIAFLLFLGVTLSMFSSSNSIISNANNDLVNGTVFRAVQVRNNYQDKDKCVPLKNIDKNEDEYYWYQMDNNILIKITSRYGVVYWPRDFINNEPEEFYKENLEKGTINTGQLYGTYNNISYSVTQDNDGNDSEGAISLKKEFEITFTDEKNKQSKTTLTVGDICG